MATLSPDKQDGSFPPNWAEVRGGECDTPAVEVWHRQSRLGMAGYFVYRIQDLLPGSEDAPVATEAQAAFDKLAAEWKRETAHLSSPGMIAEHRAYQEIVGMGQEAIPMILRALKKDEAQWFWALRSIARESPVQPEDRDNVAAMTAAWLALGKRRHYIRL